MLRLMAVKRPGGNCWDLSLYAKLKDDLSYALNEAIERNIIKRLRVLL